jgi:hypothetical protein
MNAGPDVERSIAQWLREESPGRAPDRILANAAETIDRTKQRRFAVAWREPVSISMRGLALAAAVVVIAVVGAGWIGRSTANVGTQPSNLPSGTPVPSATAHAVTIAEYKAARDAICGPAVQQVIVLNIAGESFHPDTSADDAVRLADNIEQVIAVGTAATNALAQLDAPPSLASEHAIDVARHRDSIAILTEAVAKLRSGDISGGLAFADATGPLSAAEEAYENKYGLSGCP